MGLFVTVVIFSRVCKLRFLSWDIFAHHLKPEGKKEGKRICYGLAFGHSYEWPVELVCEAKLNNIDGGMGSSPTRT